MQWRRPGRWVGFCLMLGLLAVPAAFGQQKYRLRDAHVVGDLCVVDTSTDVDMMVTVSARGDQQTLPVVTRERENFREQVLGVDKQGLSGLRRTYSIARRVVVDPSLQETRAVSPLQGKTITIQRKGEKVTVTQVRGNLPQAARRRLEAALHSTGMEFLPEGEVAVGEEWTVDPMMMAELFPGMEKAEAKYHFQEVVPYAGHQCARIRITMEMSAQQEDVGAPITAQLTGDMFHALDLKRTLALELSGPTTVQAQSQANGVALGISGDGTLRIKETRRWLRVRGQALAKPVAASPRRRARR